jgi:alcohol dehydrogenase class IV
MSVKHAYYRVFQAVFGVGAHCLPWRKATPIAGAGSISKIPQLLSQEGKTHPVVVTDPGLVKAGVAQKILDVLDAAGVQYALYSDVEPNPSVDTVNKITELYQAENCDSFVAIGGGSSMDAAKGANARITKPKKDIYQLGGLLKILKKTQLFIAVPTTAGTGSETTIAALITDTKTHHKYAIMDVFLIPKYAVLDPELTLGLPPHITSTTGMDALTHAVEAYLSWTYNTAETKQFALDATQAIFANLEKVYADGSNVEARNAMMLASYKAGFAFTRASVGNVHAIAHTLGGLYNTPHGLANAVIMPIVLEDYGSKVYGKLSQLAQAAGIASGDASEAENAQAFIAAIYGMNQRMGIPKGFDNIQDKDVDQMTAWALKEANPLYPVPVLFTASDFKRVIEKVRD